MNTREFAGYAIVRNLAGGGMTRLFVALDSQQRRVVVRYLTEDWARRRRYRKSFFHGADVIRRLDHPNIIRVYEQGYSGRIPYMVLEYVESRTLRELILNRDPLLTQNVLSLMRQIAAGLFHIHSAGFLHLDLKPDNILVQSDGRVVIIDFDLAVKQRWRPVRIRRAHGTPGYVAPETILRRVVDERSDIYSFGVTGYEMLTCHKPFEGDRIEKVRADQMDPNVRPTPLRSHNPSAPLAMESLIFKCLAKEPADRYPSMSLVIRDLEALI
jgi:serine/threonine-protein kinase